MVWPNVNQKSHFVYINGYKHWEILKLWWWCACKFRQGITYVHYKTILNINDEIWDDYEGLIGFIIDNTIKDDHRLKLFDIVMLDDDEIDW